MNKTIRLLYPEYLAGGLKTYYFGAYLLNQIVPQNKNQYVFKVPVIPPGNEIYEEKNGVYAFDQIQTELEAARNILQKESPSCVITLGGNCLVSLPAFDYLHGRYENTGIIWIDAHPDVTGKENHYPFAHAMVLRTLLGDGDEALSYTLENAAFTGSDLLYIGLQGLFDYQKEFLDKKGVHYTIQNKKFLSDEQILAFMKRFDHILVHFDIDVLDARFFHETYFANPDLTGDGSGGGRMRLEKLGEIFSLISKNSDVVGFTCAEFLPFEEEALHDTLKKMKIFEN